MRIRIRITKQIVVLLFSMFLITACGGGSSSDGGGSSAPADSADSNGNASNSGGNSGTSDDDDASDDDASEETVAWKAGEYVDRKVTGGGLSGATMTIRVTDNGAVKAEFKGKRYGENFRILLEGSFYKDNKWTATGDDKGTDLVRVAGNFNSPSGAPDRLNGSMRGTVNGKNLKTAFQALAN